MKIAVTSKGDTLESELDPRFGRANYLIILDAQTLAYEAIDNRTNKNAFKGAGIQAAASLADNEAKVLLTGFCGPNAFKTLEAAGIKVVNDQEGSVMDAVLRFKNKNVVFADNANKDGHW